ncbi:hypothetical protein E4A48_01280 [Xanthomonas cerealis pv. cerealis]|uniref:Uncharacterized protein n=1 Tax=Xanthomonas cerealis pv. cerealis TaxID=152263 RepID=A0A514E929_9XANT|nr:hypothetical protein [Xanthomonas translucens]QDI02512.1 hypothetical protein E4A48_01280 [Xanthomonas translucens pv. cerealis]
MNYPDPQTIIDALGKIHDSEQGARLFEALNLKEKDLRPDPLNEQGRRIYEDKTRGLQLEFEDEGQRREIPYHDIGEGPWVLDQVFLRSEKGGGNAYPGVLPYGIRFDMSKNELSDLLGPPTKSSPRVDVWKKEQHKVFINYDMKSGAVKSLGMQPPTD